jgi:hypothetical protein
MKLDCVLTAVNDNNMYLDFVPIFIKTWNKLYPLVDVKIILISKEIPEHLKEYQDNIILFEPLSNISTAFISQYIRLLYPAILNYQNGILITDIDMLPMNKTYYIKNIENIDNDKFIYMRNVLLQDWKQIAMCYNVATNKVWNAIFQIKSLDDIKNTLINKYNEIKYVDGHGNSGWSTDQIDLYNSVMKWNTNTNKLIILNDTNTEFCRLDRIYLTTLNEQIFDNIKNGKYSDYHCCRPFKQYEILNNKIYELL